MSCRWSLLLAVAIFAGCTSLPKPSLPSMEGVDIPLPKISNPLAAFQAEEGDANLARSTPGMPKAVKEEKISELREQLIYGPPDTRIAACERLGQLAAIGARKDSETLLNAVWNHDPSHEVRMAAANVLSQSKAPVTPEAAEDQGAERLSLLPKFWK